MEQNSMTALVSAFARAYHAENNTIKIFNDSVARTLLTEEEYEQISKNMAEGIRFFNKDFIGTPEEALRWIADNQLSPSPLSRAAFAEKALATAVAVGARQYLILGAGYDTFAYRQPQWAKEIQIFEADHPIIAEDKKKRLAQAGITPPDNIHYIAVDFTDPQWQTVLLLNTAFNAARISFCSMLGLVYYLSENTFARLLASLSSLFAEGSTIVLDYPEEAGSNGKNKTRAQKQEMLAEAAQEKMLAAYSYNDLEQLLSEHGFLIYEHVSPAEMTRQYFTAYNQANPDHPMKAFAQVNYCLAVKK